MVIPNIEIKEKEDLKLLKLILEAERQEKIKIHNLEKTFQFEKTEPIEKVSVFCYLCKKEIKKEYDIIIEGNYHRIVCLECMRKINFAKRDKFTSQTSKNHLKELKELRKRNEKRNKKRIIP